MRKVIRKEEKEEEVEVEEEGEEEEASVVAAAAASAGVQREKRASYIREGSMRESERVRAREGEEAREQARSLRGISLTYSLVRRRRARAHAHSHEKD